MKSQHCRIAGEKLTEEEGFFRFQDYGCGHKGLPLSFFPYMHI